MIKYNKLYQDYVAGKFPGMGNPGDVDWKTMIDDLPEPSKIHNQVKKILKSQNADLTSPGASEHLKMLDDPNSRIIITGQQLGLMVSPLYTVYKAATVLKMVKKLNNEQESGKIIPVFWLETEDHDFQEINRFGIWDRGMIPQKIIYPGRDQQKKPIREYYFESEINEVVSKLKETLVETEFTSDLIGKLSAMYDSGENWVAATRSLLNLIFEQHGLLYFQPGTPEIKSVSAPFFREFLQKSEHIDSLIITASKDISSADYELQVPLVGGKTYVHLETADQQRAHLYRDKNGFILKEEDLRLSGEHLDEYVADNAHKFSSAVLSRPVLQSWLLPVVAYVAGPAEIAYWAQMYPLFDEFNIPAPVVYPRASITLIEPKIKRFIEKHSVDLSAIPHKKQDFIHDYYAANNLDSKDPFKEMREKLSTSAAEFKTYIKDTDATLIPASDKFFEKIYGQLDNLENKIIQARERKNHTVTSQLNQIFDAVFPADIPQERFASVVYFLSKFGPDFVDDLMQNMDVENFQHQLIDIA